MISLILTDDTRIRDSIVRDLQLEKSPHPDGWARIYRRAGWILIEDTLSPRTLKNIALDYAPDHIFVPVLWESLSGEHRIWDIIIPHTFLKYNPLIEKSLITKDNRDTLIGEAFFLDYLGEQWDFLEEDYGISIGGIVLSSIPKDIDDELATKLTLVYEADIMIEADTLTLARDMEKEGITPSLLFGVEKWKLVDIPYGLTPSEFAIKNLIKTMKLIQSDDI